MTGDDRAWDEVLAHTEAWRQRALKTLALRQEVRELHADNARLRREIDEIIGMCLGDAGIGAIHAKARAALKDTKP